MGASFPAPLCQCAGEMDIWVPRPPTPMSLSSLLGDVLTAFGLILGVPRDVASLACASRELRGRLSNSDGSLRVTLVKTSNSARALEILQRVSFRHLEAIWVDLSRDGKSLLRKDAERMMVHLGEGLKGATMLRCLTVRLASFDASFERIRLGQRAWGALVQGLGCLGRHQRLRSLELSFIPIRFNQATRVVGLPAGGDGKRPPGKLHAAAGAAAGIAAGAMPEPLSLLGALSCLRSLEDLVLTHNDLFGDTALELARVFRALPRLRSLDVARNRLSRQVVREVRAALSPNVKIRGSQLQTNTYIGIPSYLHGSLETVFI